MEEGPVRDREELRTAVALFRHALVSPLASKELERGELTRELHRIARRRHDIPGTRRGKVGVSTLRRWLAAYRQGGFEALKPGLRSDYGTSRAIPEVWITRAMELRQDLPSRSTRVQVEIMERLPDYPGVNVHTLDTILRKRGMPRRPVPSRPTRRKKRWTAEHVNSIWQGDATPGIWLPDPRDPEGERKVSTVLFLWVDDFSRLVPYAQFFFDEKLPPMERSLKVALARRGLPGAVYTDRGHVYRALQFKAALAEQEVREIKSRAYYPEGRGKIERLFGVLQSDYYPEVYAAIKHGQLRTLSELNESLWAWLERVYHRRVHSETKKTPLDAFREGGEHVSLVDPVKLARAFLWRYVRTVTKNGFLSLHGNTYSVDPGWAGRRLELRLDPFDLSRVDVYSDCRPVARAVVRELKKSTVKALDLERLEPPPALEPTGVSFIDMLRREFRRQQAAELGEVSFHRALSPNPHDDEEENR